MKHIVIDKRFCGPPRSGNGGYVCGLLAAHVDGNAEITLRAPPPLGQRLDIVTADHGVELRKDRTTLAIARSVHFDAPQVPIFDFGKATDAVRRSQCDDGRHPLPMCFVCGPARVNGDGLRISPVPLPSSADHATPIFAARWVPYANLAREDGAIAAEFVWAALDCPTGYAAIGSRHLGMTGAETVLLGRMSARIVRRPWPGDRCLIVAWPTGRDGRKLFANSALLDSQGEPLAIARATWLLVDRRVQLGEPQDSDTAPSVTR